MKSAATKFFALLVLLLGCAAAEAAGKIRIACVGDSITKGAGADSGQDYPSQLGRVLGAEYTVGNFGVNAATLQMNTSRPYRKHRMFAQATAFRPDIVIIMLGTNDAKPGFLKDNEAFLSDMRAMIATFAGLPTKPKVFVCKPIPVFDDGYGISTGTLKDRVTPLIEQVAKEKNVPLIDCYTPFAGKSALLPDTVHPNAEGNVLLAKTIAAAIKGAPPAKAVEAKPGDARPTPRTPAAPFAGEKEQLQDGERYSFEFDGLKCFVVVPQKPAPGRPWVLRALPPELLGSELELVKKGFHVASIDIFGMFGAPKALAHWDAFYKLMTERHGLAAKVALIGLSRGGLPVHKWAAANPDKVACIVGIAPVCDIKSWPGGKGLSGGHGASWKLLLELYGMTEQQAMEYKQNPVDLVEPIAKAKIPVLHIYSPQDEGVPYEENTKVVAEKLKAMGGDFTGIAVEVKRSSIENHPALKSVQEQVDRKNPKAVAGAHRTVCGTADQAATAAFILKHAGAK
jgi:lysophospholipase L1-like esterase